jgi:transcriptional regulator with XRE-family HTH domain
MGMDLRTYLEKQKLSPAQFAEKIGVHRTSVIRFRDRTRKPDLDTIQKIHEVTKGRVTAKDFFQPSEAAE